MNGIDFGLTESVQGAGGAGFVVPIFRANAGVNQATATPQSRSMGGGIDEIMGEFSVDGLDPLSIKRDELDSKLMEFYEWNVGVMEKGYDPRRIDASNPESFKVAKDFQRRKLELRRLVDDVKLSGRLKQDKEIIAPAFADAQTMIENGVRPEFDDIVRKRNAAFTASGYDKGESFDMAMGYYMDGLEELASVYEQALAQVGDDPKARQRLKLKYDASRAGLQAPFRKDMTDYQQQSMEFRRMQHDLAMLRLEGQTNSNMVLDQETVVTRGYGDEVTYQKQIFSFPEKSVFNSSGVGFGADGKPKKIDASSSKVDRFEILPIDSKGNPIAPNSRPEKGTKIAGFKVFSVESAKNPNAGKSSIVRDPITNELIGSEEEPDFIVIYGDPDRAVNKFASKDRAAAQQALQHMKYTASLSDKYIKQRGQSGSATAQPASMPSQTQTLIQTTQQPR